MHKNRRLNMRKKHIKIALSLIIVLQTIFSFFVPTFAMDINVKNSEYVYNIPTEIIPEDEFSRIDPVSRAFAAETDLNTICLINRDGTGTLLLFNEPVKYIAEDGLVHDKSNKLSKSNIPEYQFYNKENDINTYFPMDVLKTGVKLTDGKRSITTFALGNQRTAKYAQLIDDKTIYYNNAFGNDTALQYSSTFNGYKEEIVLYSKNVPLNYEFNIECSNLYLREDLGNYSFVDTNTNEVIAKIRPFVMYDSSESPQYIELENHVEMIGENKYKITIILDETILNDRELKYPVYVDPSYDFTNSYNTIEDAMIYSGRPNTNYGYALMHNIGYIDDTNMGTGRLLVKIPGFFNNTFVRILDKSYINSVQLHYYNSSLSDYDSVVNLYSFTDSDWDEYTVTYNSISNWDHHTISVVSSAVVSASSTGYVSYDITQKAKAWITSNGNINKGFIFINSNETSDEYLKSFISKDNYGTGEPYISMDFTVPDYSGTYFINNVKSPSYFITYNTSGTLSLTNYSGNTRQKWIISQTGDGYYTIKVSGYSKYLGISTASSSEGALATTYSNTVSHATKWMIFRASSGGYVLFPYYGATYNRSLALNYDSNSNMILNQTVYTNDSSCNDEWYLEKYTLNLEAYYDDAFNVRYGGIAPVTIASLNNNAKSVFSKVFGRNVVPQGIYSYQSLADKCKIARFSSITSSNIDSICPSNPSLGGTCPTHYYNCTGWKESFDDFLMYHPGTPTTVTALFTGNALYNSSGSICNRSFTYISGNRYGISMQEINSSSSQYISSETSVYVHEISHQLGAPDHYHELYEGTEICKNEQYCSVCGGANARSSSCIMYTTSFDILSANYDSVYCEGCYNDIISHLSNHH